MNFSRFSFLHLEFRNFDFGLTRSSLMRCWSWREAFLCLVVLAFCSGRRCSFVESRSVVRLFHFLGIMVLMVIYIGADHRGFELKAELKEFIQGLGYQVFDMGAETLDENDDYPDFAAAVAGKVSDDYENAKGIVICGSGIGVDIVANKFSRVRCSLVSTSDQAFDARSDDDANVLALGANIVNSEEVKKILTTWLGTPFSDEERHRRRRDKISKLEIELGEKNK
ncbi:hypothetical protein CL629_01135 [bacterium]|nr:hypothetical protein [bacterium]